MDILFLIEAFLEFHFSESRSDIIPLWGYKQKLVFSEISSPVLFSHTIIFVNDTNFFSLVSKLFDLTDGEQ